MILGFGLIEEETAISIIKECIAIINGKNPKKELDKIKKKYSDLDKKYKPMNRNECPERYSYFYYSYYERYPGNCVVTFKFHHINRQHPFSPDGWALLESKWVLAIDEFDGSTIYKQAGNK